METLWLCFILGLIFFNVAQGTGTALSQEEKDALRGFYIEGRVAPDSQLVIPIVSLNFTSQNEFDFFNPSYNQYYLAEKTQARVPAESAYRVRPNAQKNVDRYDLKSELFINLDGTIKAYNSSGALTAIYFKFNNGAEYIPTDYVNFKDILVPHENKAEYEANAALYIQKNLDNILAPLSLTKDSALPKNYVKEYVSGQLTYVEEISILLICFSTSMLMVYFGLKSLKNACLAPKRINNPTEEEAMVEYTSQIV